MRRWLARLDNLALVAVLAGGSWWGYGQLRPGRASVDAAPARVAPSQNVNTSEARRALEQLTVKGRVTSVVDGDTLHVEGRGSVRLAQVDAPETHECFGSESTLALSHLVTGKVVTLRRPSNGPERDRYGRVLAEVGVGDVSVNEALVRQGAAEWYGSFAPEDADLAARLGEAEAQAKAAKLGLWSACTVGARSRT